VACLDAEDSLRIATSGRHPDYSRRPDRIAGVEEQVEDDFPEFQSIHVCFREKV